MSTRRKFIDMLGRLGLGGSVAPLAACGSLRHVQWPASEEHFDLVVIGSGFGGTMTALTVAYTMEARLAAARPPATPLRTPKGLPNRKSTIVDTRQPMSFSMTISRWAPATVPVRRGGKPRSCAWRKAFRVW